MANSETCGKCLKTSLVFSLLQRLREGTTDWIQVLPGVQQPGRLCRSIQEMHRTWRTHGNAP